MITDRFVSFTVSASQAMEFNGGQYYRRIMYCFCKKLERMFTAFLDACRDCCSSFNCVNDIGCVSFATTESSYINDKSIHTEFFVYLLPSIVFGSFAIENGLLIT